MAEINTLSGKKLVARAFLIREKILSLFKNNQMTSNDLGDNHFLKLPFAEVTH